MSGDHNLYGDGNVYRGQRNKDSVIKTITGTLFSMTQDELKRVLDALKWCHGGEPCGTAEAIAVVEKALAQRKPLTDEQIDEEFKLYASQFDTSSDKWLDMGADDYFKAGFKAAHGIKE